MLLLLLSLPPAHAQAEESTDVVQPISRYHLRITQIDGADFENTGWRITRPDGSTLDAADARLRTRAAELIADGWPYPSIPEHVAILAFNDPWGTTPGHYTLSMGSQNWSFDWDPTQDISPTLHLNPLGDRPDSPQTLALASTWNVDGPPITLNNETWSIIDNTSGTIVKTGTWQLRAPATTTQDDAYSNSFTRANVYQADLSGLNTGSYHLLWDGVGRSWDFRIAPDAWDTPFRTVLGGLLNQRCGIAIDGQWSRPACHLAPIERTTADYQIVGEDAFSALPAAATGIFVDAPGGYHDAGDYDRNIGHLAIVHALTELYEIDPQRFSNDDLGLPESGNGLPDVLDESLWAMAPWTALQDDDGGVPGGIGTTAYPAYTTMPQDDTGPWYATAADPQSSYIYAAAGAALARALRLAGETTEADAYLDRAQRAWAWAEAHPTSAYNTDIAAAHAAAELARTTDDPAWADIYRTVGPFRDSLDWNYAPWDPTIWDDGLWAIANANAAPADLRAAAQRVILARADDDVVKADARSVPLAVHAYAAVAFGSATTPSESRILFRAYTLSPNADYLRVGTQTAAHTLGLNATGTSWVTGLGPNAVRHPLHTPSLADGIDAALAGLPVYGPATYNSSSGILGAALSAYSPSVDSWPLHERFADVSYVPQYNEFTITESLATTLYAFGYLAALESTETPDPTDDTGTTQDTASPDALSPDPKSSSEHCGCATGEPMGYVGLGWLMTGVMRRRRGSV